MLHGHGDVKTKIRRGASLPLASAAQPVTAATADQNGEQRAAVAAPARAPAVGRRGGARDEGMVSWRAASRKGVTAGASPWESHRTAAVAPDGEHTDEDPRRKPGKQLVR